MKKLFNFRLLVLIGVLIMSVSQMWAGKKTIYFDVQYISWWKTDDVVKVHAWGGTETEDVSMTVYSGNMLTCQINDDQTSVCFYRYYNSKWNEQTINKTDAATKNCWTLWTSTSDSKNEISNGYEYEPTAGLLGGMNSWNAGTLSFDGDGNVEVALPAGQTYQFKILDGTTWYSYNSYGFSTSATDFTLYTSNSECSITTSTAGTYHFHWDRTNHTLCIFFPNDYAKARLTKSKYIYFDARKSDSDHWNQAAFASRFYFKHYDSGQDQSNTFVLASAALETSVYPVTVPNNDYIGRVQINRWSADGKEDWTNATSVIHAYTRSSSAENCIVIPDGQASSWTPSVEWTTYCPPMSSATLSNNSTSVISWTSGNGTSGNPYLVPADGTVKVSASATSAFPSDDNMTIKYDFKVSDNGGEASSNVKTTNTYDKGSLTNNHTYTITLDAYNTYNGAEGTKLTASQTLYYKALDTYSITNTLTNISSNGRSGSDAAAYNIAYTATLSVGTGYNLPASITVKRGETTLTSGTHYSYNSSTGALTINAAQVTGNLTIIASGVAKTYSEENNLDKNTGDNHGTYTATFDATTIAIDPAPTKTNYHVAGYYLEAELSNCIADASGNLVAGVTKSAVTYTDGDGKWKKDGNVTLYTKWEENSFTVTVSAGAHGSVSTTSVTAHPITASSNFTVTANAGYAFSHWTFSEENQVDTNYISTGGTNNATQTFNITATKAITMTANYVVRYGLYGSLDAGGDPAEGMPGWTVSADFSYSAGTYTISRTLTKPNTNYKFRVLDRRNNFSYGCGSNYTFMKNDEATTLNSGNFNAYIATAGKGSHTLTVTEVNDGAYPAVTISSHPESYVVTLGVKSVNDDGSDAGDLGGTVTATDAAGNTYASGSYIASGETVTVTAGSIPTGYHFVGWWNSSAYSSGAFSTENPTSWTVDGAVNAYVKFIEDTNTFSAASGSNWNTIANWSAGHVPAITDVVYITAPVTVDIANAKAKRVYIDQSSAKTGKLTVGAGKALVVAATIQKINSSSEIVATEETDIVLESDGTYGTGALVAGSASTTTKATVHFYSKAKKDGSGNYINQYFGTPMDSVSKLNYYGSYLRKFDQPSDSWVSITEEKLGPWTAYRIMRDEESEGTYQIGGTLLLPGTGDGKTKTLTLNTSVGHDNDNMFANSWAAPISIAKFDASDFTGATATIYIFNAGSAADYASYGSSTASKDAHAGQWIAIPVSSVKSRPGDYDLHVIPSQQAFLVQASGTGAHSLALDYKKLVYDTIAGAGASIVPTCAPQRLQANDLEVVGLYMTGESGLGDRVLMYVRDDFSADEMDNGWEAYKLPGSAFAPQLCAYSGLGEMSISATNVIEGTVLGFYAGTEDSEYTFTFDYEGEQVWYLNDLEAQQSTLIDAEHSYEFSAVPGTVAEHRFVVSHTPIAHVPTGIDNSAAIEGVKARKQMINGILYIIRGGQIYSTDGQIVK